MYLSQTGMEKIFLNNEEVCHEVYPNYITFGKELAYLPLNKLAEEAIMKGNNLMLELEVEQDAGKRTIAISAQCKQDSVQEISAILKNPEVLKDPYTKRYITTLNETTLKESPIGFLGVGVRTRMAKKGIRHLVSLNYQDGEKICVAMDGKICRELTYDTASTGFAAHDFTFRYLKKIHKNRDNQYLIYNHEILRKIRRIQQNHKRKAEAAKSVQRMGFSFKHENPLVVGFLFEMFLESQKDPPKAPNSAELYNNWKYNEKVIVGEERFIDFSRPPQDVIKKLEQLAEMICAKREKKPMIASDEDQPMIASDEDQPMIASDEVDKPLHSNASTPDAFDREVLWTPPTPSSSTENFARWTHDVDNRGSLYSCSAPSSSSQAETIEKIELSPQPDAKKKYNIPQKFHFGIPGRTNLVPTCATEPDAIAGHTKYLLHSVPGSPDTTEEAGQKPSL